MARGIYIYTEALGRYIHTYTDLGLLYKSEVIGGPEVKTAYVDVPGLQGSKDMTEALGVGVVYGDRELVFQFYLDPDTDQNAQYSKLLSTIHGKKARIIRDADPRHYFEGRIFVEPELEQQGHTYIATITATCRPFLKAKNPTTVNTALTTTAATVSLMNNGARPILPTLTLTSAATLTIGGTSVALNAGSHQNLAFIMQPGMNTFTARTTSGTATLTVTFTEEIY